MSNVANANPLDAGSNANSIETAAEAFTALISSENAETADDRKPRPRKSEPAPAPDADEPEDDGQDADDADEHGDDSDEDHSADDDGENDGQDEDDGEGDDSDDNSDDDDQDQTFEVQVNGEAKEVKLSDLITGYSQNSDYRAKSERLANERREVEEYAREVVVEREHYAGSIQNFLDLAAAFTPTQAQWDALKQSNPQAYIQSREQFDALQGKVQEAQAERAKIAERETAEAQRERVNYVRAETSKLLEKMPHLANPKKADAFRQKLFTYGRAAGYSEDEIKTGAIDHRDIITMWKAAKWDELQASRKSGQRPPKDQKQSPSSSPRSIGRNNKSDSKALDKARQRAARSGSVEDAGTVFSKIISAR